MVSRSFGAKPPCQDICTTINVSSIATTLITDMFAQNQTLTFSRDTNVPYFSSIWLQACYFVGCVSFYLVKARAWMITSGVENQRPCDGGGNDQMVKSGWRKFEQIPGCRGKHTCEQTRWVSDNTCISEIRILYVKPRQPQPSSVYEE